MKTLRTIFAFLVGMAFVVAVGAYCARSTAPSAINMFEIASDWTLNDLLDAIEQVESGGDPNAIGPDGEIGSYQIRKIYADDVNRILGKNKFTYDDRKNRLKSRDMTKIYIEYYEQHSEKLYPYGWLHRELNKNEWKWGKQTSFERMARIHNGGPNGWKKDCTKPYWEKVKKRMSQVTPGI